MIFGTSKFNKFSKLTDALELLDFKTIYDKGKLLKCIGSPRMYHSIKMDRVHRTLKFLSDTGFRYTYHLNKVILYVIEKINTIESANYTSIHDDNVPILALVLKELNYPTLSGLSTSFGKMKPINDNSFDVLFKTRLDDWFFVQEDKHSFYPDWYSRFSYQVKKLLSRMRPNRQNKFLSFKTFVNEFGLWATTGAIDDKKDIKKLNKYFNSINLDLKLVVNKWSFAFTTDNLYDYVMKKMEMDKKRGYVEISLVEKNEGDSVRLVVLGDLVSYLIKSYFSYLGDRMLSGISEMFLFTNKRNQGLKWAQRVRLCSNGGKTFIDSDISGWDSCISHRIINIVQSEYVGLLKDKVVGLDNLFTDQIFSFINWATVHTKLGDRFTTNGLPSGDRWTTLINTITNICANKVVEDILGGNYIDDIICAGDDSDIVCNDVSMVDKHWQAMTLSGFKINKIKSSTSGDRGEFLKMFYNKKTVTGNPLRIIRSLLWSIEDERNLIGDEKRVVRADIWTQFISRVLNYEDKYFLNLFQLDTNKYIKDTIIEDLYLAFNKRFSKRNIDLCIHTSSQIGGMGIIVNKFPDQLCVIKWENYTKEMNVKKFVKELEIVNPTILRFNPDQLGSITKIATGGQGEVKKAKLVREMNALYDNSPSSVINDVRFSVILDRIEFGELRTGFPTNRQVQPDDGLNYTKSVLTKTSVKTTIEDFHENKYFLDTSGNKFTQHYVDWELSSFIYNFRHKKSLNLLEQVLDGSILSPSTPKSLSLKLGEVLPNFWWNVVASRLSVNSFFESNNITNYLLPLLILEIDFNNGSFGRPQSLFF